MLCAVTAITSPGGRISTDRTVSRRTKILLPILLLVGLPVAAFALVEGASSLVLLARDGISAFQQPPSEYEISTEYDAELGWVAKKSLAAPDMYGRGVALHTNDRGFRGRGVVADAVPAGKQRLVCSGDSFALGHGVGDADTWCSQLANPAVETVNMGQVGYGIDQAYLWYRRGARTMDHSVHILAVVTDDFRRMGLDRFLGYAKPTLTVDGDSLAVVGVPTPRGGARVGASIGRVVQSLRSALLVARLTNRETAAPPAAARLTAAQTRAVLARLIADLRRLNAAKQSRLVLVYLPVERDFINEAARPWRAQMRSIADSLDVPFIDLIPALRELPYPTVQSLYVHQSVPGYEDIGQFTAAGNRWAADRIRDHLGNLGILPPTAATAALSRVRRG